MLRALALSPALLAGLLAAAQANVRIIEPSAIVDHPDLAHDAAALAGLKAAGIAPEGVQDILRLSEPAAWPIGLRSDSARAANRGALRNYAAFLACSYATDEGSMAIVSIPAALNHHMPGDLHPAGDFFLVLRAGGVEAYEPEAAKAPPSKGPAWQRLPKARIMRPDGIYSTYELGADAEALAALEKQGLSKAEIEAVVFRSHERNWPAGIERFEKRFPRHKQMRRYKAYRLARWGDKVLLAVPAEANRKAAEGLRPLIDIYMVFMADAVQVKGRK